MDRLEPARRTWRTSLTKALTFAGGVFFLLSTAVTPAEVTIEWSFFFFTYGPLLLLGLLGLGGFLVCRNQGERLSPVYAVCPSLFVITFSVVLLAPIYRLRWPSVFP